jgi:hypothetical protein
MQAIRAPFIGIVVAVALLCVENIGALAYRAHMTEAHARVEHDVARDRLIEQLTRKVEEAQRLVPRCVR